MKALAARLKRPLARWSELKPSGAGWWRRSAALALAARRRDSAVVSPQLEIQFAPKAGRRIFTSASGRGMTADDFVISADEKTSVQARHRCHATQPPRAGMVMKVEHEYKRAGAWAYLAALDVHHARLFGRCESTTGSGSSTS